VHWLKKKKNSQGKEKLSKQGHRRKWGSGKFNLYWVKEEEPDQKPNPRRNRGGKKKAEPLKGPIKKRKGVVGKNM